MMTSDQIAQQHGHNFRAGYGGNAGLNSYESMTGFTPFGHGAGSQAGVSALSGMSSLANTSQMVGLGAMAGGFLLGKLGLGGSAVAAGLSRTAMLTGMNLPAALSLGVLTPAIAALGGAASGAQQYAQTQNVMDKAFGTRLGMGGAFGYGVSRQDALSLTESMRQLAAVPEMMTSMSELQQVLGKVSTMGIMQGMRDAKAFKQKFSELTGALRDMSKSLGTTLEETLPFLQSATRQGFLDVGQITSSVKRGAAMGSVGGGMAHERMFQIQETGADIVRSLGGDSRLGSTGAQNMVGSLNTALSMGIITADDLMRTTGKTGEEGIEVLSKRYLGANASFMQNNRFFAAALAERDGQGMFTGKINETMLDRLQRGDISGAELMRAGQRSLSELTSEQALSFVNSMERGMGAEMGALAGPSGSARMITAVLEANGAKSKEAQRRLVQQMMNINQAEADMMLQIIERAGEVRERREQEVQQAMQRDRSAAYFKEHMTVKGLTHHLSTGARAMFVDPFMSSGARAARNMSARFDELQAEFVGSGFGGKLNMVLNPFAVGDELIHVLMGTQRTRGMAGEATDSQLIRQMLIGGGDAGDVTYDEIVDDMTVRGELGATPGNQSRAREKFTRMYGKGRKSLRERVVQARQESATRKRAVSVGKLKHALLEEGYTLDDLVSVGRSNLESFVSNLGDDTTSGLQVLADAEMSGLAGAGTAIDNLLLSTESRVRKGVSTEDAASAYTDVEEMFGGPGWFDSMSNLGDRFGHEVGGDYFMQSSTMLDMMKGGSATRAQLLSILGNKDVLKDLALARTMGDDAVRALIKRTPSLRGLTVEQVKDMGGAAASLFEGKSKEKYVDVRVAGISGRAQELADILDAAEAEQTSKSRGQFFRQAFGPALGGSLADLAAQGGMGNYLKMADTLRSTDESTLTKSQRRLRAQYLTDYVKDADDQDAILTTLGLDDPIVRKMLSLDNDKRISAEEKRKINAIKGNLVVTSPAVRAMNTQQGQLSAEMGITAKLLQETVEMRTKEVIAHTGMIRAIGETVPALNNSALKHYEALLSTVQGTQTRQQP